MVCGSERSIELALVGLAVVDFIKSPPPSPPSSSPPPPPASASPQLAPSSFVFHTAATFVVIRYSRPLSLSLSLSVMQFLYVLGFVLFAAATPLDSREAHGKTKGPNCREAECYEAVRGMNINLEKQNLTTGL